MSHIRILPIEIRIVDAFDSGGVEWSALARVTFKAEMPGPLVIQLDGDKP